LARTDQGTALLKASTKNKILSISSKIGGVRRTWALLGVRQCNWDGKDVTFLNISLTVAKNAGDWRIAAMHFSTLTGGTGPETKETN
jgi:hypothetical protein